MTQEAYLQRQSEDRLVAELEAELERLRLREQQVFHVLENERPVHGETNEAHVVALLEKRLGEEAA